jgi:hypothetical protein
LPRTKRSPSRALRSIARHLLIPLFGGKRRSIKVCQAVSNLCDIPTILVIYQANHATCHDQQKAHSAAQRTGHLYLQSARRPCAPLLITSDSPTRSVNFVQRSTGGKSGIAWTQPSGRNTSSEAFKTSAQAKLSSPWGTPVSPGRSRRPTAPCPAGGTARGPERHTHIHTHQPDHAQNDYTPYKAPTCSLE